MATVAALDGNRVVAVVAASWTAGAPIAADATAAHEERSSDIRHRLDPVERLRPADGRPTVAWCPACPRRFRWCNA